MPHPKFNTTRKGIDQILQGKPPVRFPGVTVRVFPLRANMYRLRAFCDAYLNIAPDVVQFRPLFPYVYLMAVNYGQMAAAYRNAGWVSQHEIAFAVPLEWYRVENGKLVFVDWATVCPFIYVDEDMSLSTGREVYGWPKSWVWLDPEVDPWVADPRTPAHPMVTVSTMVFPRLYAGETMQRRIFLEIQQKHTAALLQVPPDLTGPESFLSMLPRAAAVSASLVADALPLLTRLPIFGYPRLPGVQPLLAMLQRTLRFLNPFAPPPAQNQITLKQFRDAEIPNSFCYQALVNSGMRVEKFNGGGVLGEQNLLRGDPSGGFEIRIHRYPSQPIIESFGLEVADAGGGDPAVATLQPVFPFWIDQDLEYGRGTVICWRTRTSEWSVSEDPAPTRASKTQEPSYNMALGAAVQAIAGPFNFPNVTLRVLPLMADPACLEHFCGHYLKNDFYSFVPWGSYVYLIATNYGEIASDTDAIGRWADRELTVAIPVKWCDADGKLLSVALVPAFVFANSGTAAITAREVNGLPTVFASLGSPPNAWMTESGPSETTDQTLLVARTLAIPAVGQGQHIVPRDFLEIRRGDALPWNEPVRWRLLAESWGPEILRDHRAMIGARDGHQDEFKRLKALALEPLIGHEPINTISLKQFRDADDPNRACYQSIVRSQRTIDHVYDLREIEDAVHVRIHRHPSLPLVEMLGLKVKWMDATGESAVDIVQPIRPFWMKVAMSEQLGQNLCYRAGTEVWQRDSTPPLYFVASTDTDVGPSLVDLADAYKQGLSQLTTVWSEQNQPRLTRADAGAAVAQVEPQAVLSSVLSKEWDNYGNPRSLTQTEKPDFCIPSRSIDPVGPVGPTDQLQGLDNLAALVGEGFAKKLTADRAWYSEEPREWDPGAAWLSPTQPDPPDPKPSS